MSPDREVSMGELVDRVTDLTLAIRELRTEIAEHYVRKDVYKLAHDRLVDEVANTAKRHDEEITALEQRQTLIARTAVTALVIPIVILIVAGILSGVVPR
jgi:CHASE3 domain sensor protein